MADAVRYFFDEHQPNALVHAMRGQGADCLTIHEAGRSSLPDEEQIRFATAQGRCMVTFDQGFPGYAADFQARGETFAGIIYCAASKYMNDYRRQIRDLLILHGVYTADDMLNHLEYL